MFGNRNTKNNNNNNNNSYSLFQTPNPNQNNKNYSWNKKKLFYTNQYIQCVKKHQNITNYIPEIGNFNFPNSKLYKQ